MCKRKVNTKRRRRRNAAAVVPEEQVVAAPVDPVNDRLNYAEPVPEARMVEQTAGKPKVAAISADEALILPTKGRAGLKRVFLGLGWAGGPGKSIDVDCCCAPFSKGVNVSSENVWFGNLRSTDDGGGYCSTKHSGDVLTGQAVKGGKGEEQQLEDLERIYVDLENTPESVDCFAFEGNVYTQGLDFSHLDSAYIRLVNADTNQELARCSLGNGQNTASMTSERVLLFAKMYRGKDRWVLHPVCEGRPEELRKTAKEGQRMPEFLVPTDRAQADNDGFRDAPASISNVPMPQVMEGRGGNDETGGASKKGGGVPKAAYLVGGIALGTVVGVAAAAALFGPGNLSVEGMGSEVFGAGVDFGHLVGSAVPTDCGCCHDCECLGSNLGESCGDAYDCVFKDLCVCKPCTESCGVENPCEQCCCLDGQSPLDLCGEDAVALCSPCVGLCGPFVGVCQGGVTAASSCFESGGEVCGQGIDGAQGCFESVAGADTCDLLASCGGVCQERACALLDCEDWISSVGLGGVAGGCSSACGAVQGCGESAASACGEVDLSGALACLGSGASQALGCVASLFSALGGE
mmetsp:Transcript_13701/g.27162  ORF Transcript_13701/g.27162 Transcript_13701/m.27162 type:complete len:577 (-) Transcript_13701:255-1985(-)